VGLPIGGRHLAPELAPLEAGVGDGDDDLRRLLPLHFDLRHFAGERAAEEAAEGGLHAELDAGDGLQRRTGQIGTGGRGDGEGQRAANGGEKHEAIPAHRAFPKYGPSSPVRSSMPPSARG
jgi:hypothetical protein